METLGQLMNRRREEISKQEGYLPTSLIPWRVFSERTGIPENNLVRWSKDSSTPGSFEYVYALARVFGNEVFPVLGIDIDGDFAWMWEHRNDPNVKQIMADAKERASRMVNLVRTDTPARQANPYNFAR